MEVNKELWVKRAEGLVLFVVLPLLIYFELIPLPKIVILLFVAGYCGYQLWQDPAFSRGLFLKRSQSDASKTILMRSLIIMPTLLGIIWILFPEQLFAFPAERPVVWMVVMVLYPVLSALPQEFIYRTFFFYRYDDLFSLPNATVITSAAAFAFAHIVYDNWWAVGLSFIAGLLFGLTYAKTKSLFLVTVEHAIYGWLVFTLGMGPFFL